MKRSHRMGRWSDGVVGNWGRMLGSLLAVMALGLAGGPARGQGGGFSLDWHAIAGGGATFSTGGGFSLGGTVGQTAAGPAAGGEFALDAGFWQAVELLSFHLALAPDWNLVSTPLLPADPDASQVFGGSKVVSAWEWDGVAYRLAREILPGHGYWLFSSEADDVQIRGWSVSDRRLALASGWNLVGIPSAPPFASCDLPLATDPPGAMLDTVYGWDEGTQGYRRLVSVAAGDGCWVYAFEPAVATP